MKSKNLGLDARALVGDLRAGFVRQIDSKGIKVVGVGAGVALILGMGAGFVGRAPLDSALTPHPMSPVSGTSQIAAATPPLTAASSFHPAAPARVAERDDTPIIATGDDPPNDSQSASADDSQSASTDDRQEAARDKLPVDAPVAAPPPANAQPADPRPFRHRPFRREFSQYGEAPPGYPPPWANRGPPPWAPPPPPPPGYDPD
ncbi:MAG TPA: hypothetical protein VGG68_02725 [Caulobacteraceae bacterium]|jgi:hypothetical protein